MTDFDNSIFDKTRRNLLLFSVFLFAYYFVGMDISEVSILGNKAKIEDPKSVSAFLWIIYGYFFLRFLLFRKDLLKSNKHALLRSEYVDRCFKKVAIEKFDEVVGANRFVDPSEKLKEARRHEVHLLRVEGPERDYRVLADVKNEGDRFKKRVDKTFTVRSRWLVIKGLFIGSIKLYALTPHYLEYNAPILVALAPVFWVLIGIYGFKT